MGGNMHRETRETAILGGMFGAHQTYSNKENKVSRMEGVEIERGQVTTTTTLAQNQNSAMMGGQTVYIGGGGGGGIYRENAVYATGGENISLVRGGGGGMTAGYQTFQPMSMLFFFYN